MENLKQKFINDLISIISIDNVDRDLKFIVNFLDTKENKKQLSFRATWCSNSMPKTGDAFLGPNGEQMIVSEIDGIDIDAELREILFQESVLRAEAQEDFLKIIDIEIKEVENETL